MTSLSKPFVHAEAFLHKRWKRGTMCKAMRRTSLKSILFESQWALSADVSKCQQDPLGDKPRSATGLLYFVHQVGRAFQWNSGDQGKMIP